MTEAERILNDAMLRWIVHESTVGPLTQVFNLGLPLAKQGMESSHLRLVQRILQLPSFAAIDQSPEHLSREMASQSVQTASLCVQAAQLVFRHAMLDSAAFESCRAATWADPRACLDSVGAKNVELSDVFGKSQEDLLCSKLEVFLKDLGKKSLLDKVDYVYKRCQPGPQQPRADGYRFDRERVRKLDEMRHDVMHRTGVRAAKHFSVGDEEFLGLTAEHLMGLVADYYGFTIDGAQLREAFGRMRMWKEEK